MTFLETYQVQPPGFIAPRDKIIAGWLFLDFSKEENNTNNKNQSNI